MNDEEEPQVDPEASPEYTVLAELGYGYELVALIRDEHPADDALTRLRWHVGTARRVADDIEIPDSAVGTIVNAKIHVSGIETFTESRLTVSEAIDRYGDLLLLQWRERLQSLRDDPPAGIDRDGGGGNDTLELRDPDSITIEETRLDAAEAIIRESVDALWTLPVFGTLMGPVQRFYREIEAAASAYPTIVLQLLYEAGREQHGWPA